MVVARAAVSSYSSDSTRHLQMAIISALLSELLVLTRTVIHKEVRIPSFFST